MLRCARSLVCGWRPCPQSRHKNELVTDNGKVSTCCRLAVVGCVFYVCSWLDTSSSPAWYLCMVDSAATIKPYTCSSENVILFYLAVCCSYLHTLLVFISSQCVVFITAATATTPADATATDAQKQTDKLEDKLAEVSVALSSGLFPPPSLISRIPLGVRGSPSSGPSLPYAIAHNRFAVLLFLWLTRQMKKELQRAKQREEQTRDKMDAARKESSKTIDRLQSELKTLKVSIAVQLWSRSCSACTEMEGAGAGGSTRGVSLVCKWTNRQKTKRPFNV